VDGCDSTSARGNIGQTGNGPEITGRFRVPPACWERGPIKETAKRRLGRWPAWEWVNQLSQIDDSRSRPRGPTGCPGRPLPSPCGASGSIFGRGGARSSEELRARGWTSPTDGEDGHRRSQPSHSSEDCPWGRSRTTPSAGSARYRLKRPVPLREREEVALELVAFRGDARPGRGRLPTMILTVELEREEDGRWIAEVMELPGVMCYGASRELAIANVKALALRELALRLEHGETPFGFEGVSFAEAA